MTVGEHRKMIEEERARKIIKASDELNKMVEEAMAAGLIVEFEVEDHAYLRGVAQCKPVPHLAVRVTKELK